MLLLTRVDKPALLRRLFELACRNSGQVLSYTKMLGQLQDAGNTTTSRTISSCWRAQAWCAACPSTLATWLAAVARARRCRCSIPRWRERNHEVDFIVKAGRRLTAIEVKSGRAPQAQPRTAAFVRAFKPPRTLLVGGDGLALQDFLSGPVSDWVS